MPSELEALRDAITTRLAAISDLSGVAVLSRKTAQIQSQIERALAKEKICAIVLIPQAEARAIQSRQPVLDPVSVKIRVVENALLNKTGKTAFYVAERVLAHLLHWQPPVSGAHLLIPEKPTLLELNLIGKLGEEDEEPDYVGFDVRFTTKLALSPATT